MADLNPRQERAARARAKGLTYAKVAEVAPYSDRQAAHRAITTNNDMQDRVSELLEDGLELDQLTPELVVNGLWKIAHGDYTPPGAAVRAWELLGKTKYAGIMFSDRLTIEPDSPEQSIKIAIGLVMALMKAIEGRLVASLCDPLKTQALESLNQWSEDDLRLFVYSHFSVTPPVAITKPLITLDN